VTAREHASTIAVVAAGGVLGALARYGAGLAIPHVPGTFPVGTFAVNVVGCLLMGASTVLLVRRKRAHRLWRPFLTTGVLGGFTTFSTYAVDTDGLLAGTGAQLTLGLAYLIGTLAAALAAVWCGAWLARHTPGAPA